MTKNQRYKYEMFVRVRDYGTAHAELFPESSMGGQGFARVTAAVAALDDHLKNRVVATADGRKMKTATRAGVFEYMKTLALTGRRVTKDEVGRGPFRMPRQRSIKVELSTARAFIAEAEKREEQFLRFGVPPTYTSDFRALVDELQQAVDVRINSKTGLRQAGAGIRRTLTAGLDQIRDLDAIVVIGTRQHPIAFEAWQSARHIEGQPTSGTPKKAKPAVVSEPATPAGIEPVAGVEAASASAASSTAAARPTAVPVPADVLGRAS